MSAGWKAFWLFAVIFAAAYGAEQTFVPDIVPVGLADLPQPLWAIGTAFVLRAIELMSGSVATAALVLTLGAWAQHFRGQEI
jgi:hypothetical protein